MMVLAAALSGCGPPERMDQCRSTDCRREWALARWEADPAEVRAAVAGLSEPLERLAVIEAVIEANPGEGNDLCGLLGPGAAYVRCQAISMRPHLSSTPEELAISEGIRAAEEGQMSGLKNTQPPVMALLADARSPWEDTTPERVACAGTTNQCQSEAAWNRAAAGELEAAAAACAAIDDDRYRQECYFQAGEYALDGPAGAAGAVRLCRGAPAYLNRCLSHLADANRDTLPLAASAGAEDWAAPVAELTAAGQEIAAYSAEVAATWRALRWGAILRYAYDQETEITGLPLDFLPDEAAPHVRAAVAWRLWNREAQADRDLEGWLKRLEAALADRRPRPAPVSRPQRRQPYPVTEIWDGLRPNEQEIRWTWYFGQVRRPLAAHPSIDALLCLLEAAARSEPFRERIFREAIQHPDPLVRWNAVRLLVARNPESKGVEEARQDAHVLIRLRASAPERRPAPGRTAAGSPGGG